MTEKNEKKLLLLCDDKKLANVLFLNVPLIRRSLCATNWVKIVDSTNKKIALKIIPINIYLCLRLSFLQVISKINKTRYLR